jgi:hypothetical protein
VVEQDEGGCGDGADAAGVEGDPAEGLESDDEPGVCAFTDPVGAENSATLCDLGVFVEQAAEAISSDDLDVGVDGIG